MVVLIYNNPLLDDCITGLPIDDSLETRWLRASHNTHQNQTRIPVGLHEEIPCLQQEIGVAAVQTNQDTSGVPPYLKRKLLMHHDGMISTDSDRTSRTTSCNNCKGSGGKMAILGDTSTVSDDGHGDWIHSDYSDDDNDDEEEETQRQPELGVEVGPSRNGEFPPRVRWLRRKHLRHLLTTRTRRMAAIKCEHWRHDDHHDAGKIMAVPPVQLARLQQIQDSPPPRSGKRKRNDAETETAIVRSESYNRSRNSNDDLDESTRKRQRLGSCHVEEGLGGLPASTDGACEVAAPPITITGHLSEASALSVEPRRSQRIREKLGSACVTTRMS